MLYINVVAQVAELLDSILSQVELLLTREFILQLNDSDLSETRLVDSLVCH